MIDLSKIEHIYIYPGLTDMRLGIFGLRKRILENSDIEEHSLYMFCSMKRNQIKIIEVNNHSIWIYQNKLTRGKFMWPMRGDKTELSKDQLIMIIEGSGLIKSIEHKGEVLSLF